MRLPNDDLEVAGFFLHYKSAFLAAEISTDLNVGTARLWAKAQANWRPWNADRFQRDGGTAIMRTCEADGARQYKLASRLRTAQPIPAWTAGTSH